MPEQWPPCLPSFAVAGQATTNDSSKGFGIVLPWALSSLVGSRVPQTVFIPIPFHVTWMPTIPCPSAVGFRAAPPC